MMAGASHPMGPLTLADFVGLDTLASIADVMVDYYGEDRFAQPDTLRKLVDAGHYGRKSGRGFYDYSGEKPVAVDPGVVAAGAGSDRYPRPGPEKRRQVVDEHSIERIRNANFSHLGARLRPRARSTGSWPRSPTGWRPASGEGAAADEAVAAELERVGEQTAAILTEAHAAAQAIREDAARQVRQSLVDANLTAESLRTRGG